MNMALTPLATTMENRIFSLSGSMSTTMKPWGVRIVGRLLI